MCITLCPPTTTHLVCIHCLPTLIYLAKSFSFHTAVSNVALLSLSYLQQKPLAIFFVVLRGPYTVLWWLALVPHSALLVSYLTPLSTPTHAVPGHNAGFSLDGIIMVIMIVSPEK